MLLDMLKFYVRHLEQYPNSLITRFYGCHSVQMFSSIMYFVVMENVFFSAGGMCTVCRGPLCGWTAFAER